MCFRRENDSNIFENTHLIFCVGGYLYSMYNKMYGCLFLLYYNIIVGE